MSNASQPIQCPYCYGRGYKPEGRKHGQGFYARTCRARTNGQIQPDAPNYRRACIRAGMTP